MTIKMYDPTIDYKNHKNEYDQAISTTLNHGRFIMGPEIKDVESQLASFCHSKHCITVSNGTDALMIALMALDVGHNDEVITVPFTWISTAEVVCILGAKPVFIDVDPKTYNMDVSQLESKITSKTKAIIPVSLYGQMADLEEINKIAVKYNIPVIEDGAQSFGAKQNNYMSCASTLSMCKIGCTSFFPSKPLGCFGDGGACFTNNEELANKMRAIRTHGGTERFKHTYVGTNGRMNTIQGGVLQVKLKYFSESLEKRNRNANIYNEMFKNHPIIKIPYVQEKNKHVYGQYTIQLDTQERRDGLKKYLLENDVESAVFYPISIHTQKAFDKYGYQEGDFPVSEDVCTRVLSLPCYPELGEENIEKVVRLINKYFD